jgi:hypothetical protein
VYEAFPVINWEAIVTSRKKDLEQDALNLCNNKTEHMEEKNLQLEKKLQILLAEKEAMQLSREEHQKKLELSEARLLQSSSQMKQTLAQMHILKENKECSAQVHQLKTTLEEVRSLLEELSTPQPPAGPTAAEQRLKEEAQQLR